MNKAFTLFLIIFAVSIAAPNSSKAQNFLFKEPRDGRFKFKQVDNYDFTNVQHFTGTGMLAVGFHKLLRNQGVRYPKIWAALFATGVGLLKEYEDGYREGFGMKDVMANELGIASFLFLSDITHYTVTFKQVVMGPDDYGAGIRFFRTSDFSPLNTSFGIYTIFDNRQRTWVGVDIHLGVFEKAEVHVGASMINLDNANFFEFRPNFGFALRLF